MAKKAARKKKASKPLATAQRLGSLVKSARVITRKDKVLGDVLDVYFQSPDIWTAPASASTGTNVRRRRLNLNHFLKYEFPLPPRNVQERVAEVGARTESPLTKRQETIDELDYLMSSALNQIFDGHGNG